MYSLEKYSVDEKSHAVVEACEEKSKERNSFLIKRNGLLKGFSFVLINLNDAKT